MEEYGEALRMTVCGAERCSPAHQFGPAVRDYYLVHCVFSGKGTYFVRERQYAIEPGQGFVIFPGDVTTYRADEAEPWHYGWIGYAGEAASAVTRQAGLSDAQPVFTLPEPERARLLLTHAERDAFALRLGEMSALGALLQLFAQIGQQSTANPQPATTQQARYFQKAVGYIERNLNHPLRVTDVAAFLGLCRSQVFRIFQETAGCSPKAYIQAARIRQAKELLKGSALSIKEIAFSTGFSAPEKMARAFRKEVGASPTLYRREG